VPALWAHPTLPTVEVSPETGAEALALRLTRAAARRRAKWHTAEDRAKVPLPQPRDWPLDFDLGLSP